MKGKARKGVLLLVSLLLALSLAGLAACSSQSAQAGSGTLRVGVRSDIVNFGHLNERTGNYYGLEIDIAEEMAERLGYADVEFVTVLPETRKEMLMNGEVDCLAACYSISDTRLKNFDFSPAYYTDSAVMMVENSSLIESLDDLKGLSFGTMSGSNTAPLLVLRLAELGFTASDIEGLPTEVSSTELDGFTLVQMASYQDVSEALEQGLIDVACMDGAIAQTYMNGDRHLLDTSITTQEYGVATQKDSELSPKVAEAIQGMLDDGTIESLISKWN